MSSVRVRLKIVYIIFTVILVLCAFLPIFKVTFSEDINESLNVISIAFGKQMDTKDILNASPVNVITIVIPLIVLVIAAIGFIKNDMIEGLLYSSFTTIELIFVIYSFCAGVPTNSLSNSSIDVTAEGVKYSNGIALYIYIIYCALFLVIALSQAIYVHLYVEKETKKKKIVSKKSDIRVATKDDDVIAEGYDDYSEEFDEYEISEWEEIDGLFCPFCNEVNRMEDVFCLSCGKPLRPKEHIEASCSEEYIEEIPYTESSGGSKLKGKMITKTMAGYSGTSVKAESVGLDIAGDL